MATIGASRLETLRRARGISQRALAESAGVTRQAVGAIESGRMQPGVGIALELARVLGTSVEELFGQTPPAAAAPARVAGATIGGRIVMHPLMRDHLAIEPSDTAARTTFIAGCDVAVGLLSRHTMARSRDARVLWLTMTNREALDALAAMQVHAAVVHGERGPDSELATYARFEIATTEEGWLTDHGNPLGFRGAADLVRRKMRFANRPVGSGARDLLEAQLANAGIDARRIAGYSRELSGQLDAGRAIAQGFADVAIGMVSVARSFDLSFTPLREERCTLLVPRGALRTAEIRTLLDTVRSTPYRRDLEALRAYDVSRTGETLG